MIIRQLLTAFLLACAFVGQVYANDEREYLLGAGDIVRITVFENPELTTEGRVSENGTLTFPLIGAVQVGGKSLSGAQEAVAARLRDGGFVRHPQVNMLPIQMLGSQVAVLGHVNRSGRFPLVTNTRLSDMLATAGGIADSGSDTVVLVGTRNETVVRYEVDIPLLFGGGDVSEDLPIQGGDVIYVDRAPMFYIYGEVQRAGAFRLQRNMSVMQGLATGGGMTPRGTLRGMRVHRRGHDGTLEVVEPGLDDLLRPDDVIFVKESLF